MDNAAFSVHTDAKSGLITVTVWQLPEENELKQVLAEAGVRSYFYAPATPPAHVVVKASCTWPGASQLDECGVIHPSSATPYVVVIDPSKMPPGSVLAFDYVKGALSQFLLSNEPTGAPVGDCL